MLSKRNKINYTIACVSEFAAKHEMDLKSAFQFLYKYKAIQFIKENYDIEHTMSFDDAIEDIRQICLKNGGTID